MSEPAMTAEEWAECLRDPLDYGMPPMVHGQFLLFTGLPEPINRLDAMAALCLHEQSFGFTRDDVGVMKALSQRIHNDVHGIKEFSGTGNLAGIVLDLADRIEALLPPEEPSA